MCKLSTLSLSVLSAIVLCVFIPQYKMGLIGMARPRLGEGKTERVHLVITEPEIEAIEAWRYNNRVPSKSEAIRKLCQVGLAVEDAAWPIVEALQTLHQSKDGVSATTEEGLTALYRALGPLLIGRLGVRSMKELQVEADASPVIYALWRAAGSTETGGGSS
jgi:hypothetical protein